MSAGRVPACALGLRDGNPAFLPGRLPSHFYPARGTGAVGVVEGADCDAVRAGLQRDADFPCRGAMGAAELAIGDDFDPGHFLVVGGCAANASKGAGLFGAGDLYGWPLIRCRGDFDAPDLEEVAVQRAGREGVERFCRGVDRGLDLAGDCARGSGELVDEVLGGDFAEEVAGFVKNLERGLSVREEGDEGCGVAGGDVGGDVVSGVREQVDADRSVLSRGRVGDEGEEE